MAETLPPVRRRAETLCVRDVGAACCCCSGRAHGGKDDGGITSARKYFLEWSRTIRICAGCHDIIHFCRQLSDRPVVVQHQKRRSGPKTNTPYASEVELPGARTSNIQASVVVSVDVRDVRLSYRYRRISMDGNVSVYCLANGSLYELHRGAPYVAVTYPHIRTHHRCH